MQNQVAEKAGVPILTLAALGVVFGDIGTSPLYALKESFHATHGMPINEINILEEKAFINITIKENILSLGVAEQKFWIGQFSKNCRIITNDII